jgi:hypothetical protein
MNIKNQAMVEHLLNQGAIEIAGIDNDGVLTYKITHKLEQVHPSLYDELSEQFEHHMFKMIKKGPQTMTWRLR